MHLKTQGTPASNGDGGGRQGVASVHPCDHTHFMLSLALFYTGLGVKCQSRAPDRVAQWRGRSQSKARLPLSFELLARSGERSKGEGKEPALSW